MTHVARARTTLAIFALALGFSLRLACGHGHAAPAREGDFVAHDFRFHAGGTLPRVARALLALGTPARDAKGAVTNAVLVLHGTSGSSRQFLVPQFANELYGAGQPLDTTQYYVILPDGIGHGGSSKPSDGLHAKFPHYDYEDMVTAQVPARDRAPGRGAPAARHGHVDGRHADVGVGRGAPRVHGRAHAAGMPAGGDRGAETACGGTCSRTPS